MTGYTVKQLSAMAGVSVRTLHHYDAIGLLAPEIRGESRYRYYGQTELLRLQQILFYRELEYPLKEIKQILDDPEFDLVESLEFHRKALKKRAGRLRQLLTTIDKTIVQLKNQTEMISEEDMYDGFSKEDVQEMRKEAIDAWGEDQVKAVEEKVKTMSKDEWKGVQSEGDAISRRLGEMMNLPPADKSVQQEIAKHHKHLCTFYEVSEERYRALAKMYVEDDRFRKHYDAFAVGLSDFLEKAIEVYCDNGMKV